MIDFSCPTCNTRFRVGDETAGKKVKCRKCGARLRLVGPGRADLLPPKNDPPSAPGGAIFQELPAEAAGGADPVPESPAGTRYRAGNAEAGSPLSAPVGAINLGSLPASSPPATNDEFQEILDPPGLPAPLVAATSAPPANSALPPSPGMHAAPEKRPPRWVGALFLLIGLGLLSGGGYWIWRTYEFAGRAERGAGTVVEMIEKEDNDDGGSTWAPKVKFRTAGGMEIEFVSGVSSHPPAYSPGDAVEVLYDPMNPRDASINSFVQLWLFPLLLPVIGLVLVAAGIFSVLKSA